MDNNLPIVVFNIKKPDNIKKLIKGMKIGTTVKRG
jgi:uridylate kinase